MDLVFILVAASTVIIGGVLLYLYQREYERRVNEALINPNVKRIPSTMKLIFIIMGTFTLFVLVFNIIPVLNEPNIILDDLVQEDQITNTNLDYNNEIFKLYDFKFVDGGYVVSYTNDQMYCGYASTSICEDSSGYIFSSSQISYFDESDNEVWKLGGYYASDINIGYENYQFDARAVDRLQNGNFVSLGKYVDLDTSAWGLALLEIDSTGTITDLLVLDRDEYELISYSGHQYYELLASDDGGFVIKLSDLFYGTKIWKFNADLELEWNLVPDGDLHYDGRYVDTILYDDGVYFVLQGNLVIALDEEGDVLWNYSAEDYYITSMCFYDSRLYLFGSARLVFDEMDTLLKLYEDEIAYRGIYIESVDPVNGNILNTMDFNYRNIKLGLEYHYLDPRDVVTDDEGNIYVISVDTRSNYSLPDEYIMYVLKYDQEGKYLGLATFSGSYGGWYNDNAYHTEYGQYKTTISVEDDTVVWYSPTLSLHRTFTLSALTYNTDIDNDFHPLLFSTISYLRVLFNKLIIVIYSSLVIAFIVIRIIQENRQEGQRYEEFNERKFWDRD